MRSSIIKEVTKTDDTITIKTLNTTYVFQETTL